jgi:isopenicillin N synthase-like dioxygenase
MGRWPSEFNTTKDRDDIPVIDLTNLFSNELEGHRKLAQDISQALQY